jgi:hypothetical protein
MKRFDPITDSRLFGVLQAVVYAFCVWALCMDVFVWRP